MTEYEFKEFKAPAYRVAYKKDSNTVRTSELQERQHMYI
jgi:hypothetical protein